MTKDERRKTKYKAKLRVVFGRDLSFANNF